MKITFINLILAWTLSGYSSQEACTIDAEKFCSGFTPGGEQVEKCLKDHVHELSPDCKDFQAQNGKEVFNKAKKTVKKGTTLKVIQGK